MHSQASAPSPYSLGRDNVCADDDDARFASGASKRAASVVDLDDDFLLAKDATDVECGVR